MFIHKNIQSNVILKHESKKPKLNLTILKLIDPSVGYMLLLTRFCFHQEFQLNLFLRQFWKDERMAFNKLYNSTDYLILNAPAMEKVHSILHCASLTL